MSFLEFRHNGKPVGYLSKKGDVFRTTRFHEVHFVHAHAGYGIQAGLLREIISRGVKAIHLTELRDSHHGSGRVATVYRVSPEWWLAAGTTTVLREQDGAQVFVSLGQLQRQLPPPTPPPKRLPQSMSLEAMALLAERGDGA